MEIVLEKSSETEISPEVTDRLKIYLEDAKRNDLAFFIFRYPGRPVTLASYDSLSNSSLEFVPFRRGHAIALCNLQFLALDELCEYKPIELQSLLSPSSKQKENSVLRAASRYEFQNMVLAAKGHIRKKEVDKIVLSKIKEIRNSFDPISTFLTLEQTMQNAFVYCFYHPHSGLWIGASPEKILEKIDNNVFHIHSLAGTKKIGEVWTNKELVEQKLVTDYILQRLKIIRVPDVEIEGPFDLNYGAIKHLKTRITFRSLLSSEIILQSIHPTPAVCGIPVSKAKELIDRLERYDRSYYTGYLGIKSPEQGLECYFVNLRCMQLTNDNCYIYTGAGIVKDSIPADEWNEVEAKAQTLIDCLEIHE